MAETLREATRRYRLHDKNMSNRTIAEHTGMKSGPGDHTGVPSSCFYHDGYIAAIRTERDEVVLFHLFKVMRPSMDEIADLVEVAGEKLAS